MDSHAQKEIQEYAIIMAEMVKAVCPMAFEAFIDYSVNAANFSGQELEIIKNKLSGTEWTVDNLEKAGLSKREAVEFIEKMN